jgi:hypothetical protein
LGKNNRPNIGDYNNPFFVSGISKSVILFFNH